MLFEKWVWWIVLCVLRKKGNPFGCDAFHGHDYSTYAWFWFSQETQLEIRNDPGKWQKSSHPMKGRIYLSSSNHRYQPVLIILLLIQTHTQPSSFDFTSFYSVLCLPIPKLKTNHRFESIHSFSLPTSLANSCWLWFHLKRYVLI